MKKLVSESYLHKQVFLSTEVCNTCFLLFIELVLEERGFAKKALGLFEVNSKTMFQNIVILPLANMYRFLKFMNSRNLTQTK